MLDALNQDLRSALRSLRAQPRYVAVTVLTLVLGVGANTAVFSVANAVLLRPLNLPAPERLAARDLRSFAIGAGLLAGTAMVALIIPAVRATRTDPVAVLRGD